MSAKQQLSGLFGEERPQPHSIEIEQSVLGSFLKEPELIQDGAAMLKSESAFYSMIHREIYRVIIALDTVDPLTVAHELKQREKLEAIGGELYLFELLEAVPGTIYFESHCSILIELATRRSILNAGAGLITAAYDGQISAQNLLDDMEQKQREIADGSTVKRGQTVSENLTKFLEDFARPDSGAVPYGFPGLDRVLAHAPGEMHAIAAASRTGKTTLALSFMPAQARQSIRTAIYCVETSSEVLAAKAACIIARVNYSDFKQRRISPTDLQKFHCAVAELAALDHLIFFRGQGDFVATPAGIGADVRAIEREHGKVNMIHVDYLQKLDCPVGVKFDDYNTRNSINIELLDNLNKKLHIAGVLYCQITREAQKDQGRPRLYHIKYAGQLENMAHIISMLWDAGMKDRDLSTIPTTPVDILMYSDKNRDCPDFSVELQRCPGGPYFREKEPEPRKYGPEFRPEAAHPEKYEKNDLPFTDN
jgi:replicative DNA helicase